MLTESSGSPFFIYALTDDLGAVRYVGKTRQSPPELRLRAHLSQSVKKRSHLGHWLSKMARCGKSVGFRILEKGYDGSWVARERFWIERFHGLVNATPGGEGREFLGEAGEHSRALLIASARASHSKPEVARKHAEAILKRYEQDPIFRESNRAHIEALAKDPAVRLKRQQSCKIAWQNPELRARISAIARTPEARAKRSAASKASEKVQRHLAKINSDPSIRERNRAHLANQREKMAARRAGPQ